MKKHQILSLLICSTLLTSCCLRGREDQTFLLPTTVTDSLAYKDAQQIMFLSNTGDTLKTTVQAKTEIYASSCAECYCETTKYENRSFSLMENSTTVFAIIVADASFPDELDFILGNGFFRLPISSTGNFVCDSTGNSGITCYNSRVIQNQTYQNVFELEALNVADTTISKILFNAQKGLLRMERKDGRYWEVL